MITQCKVCGTDFDRQQSQRYCSDDCRRRGVGAIRHEIDQRHQAKRMEYQRRRRAAIKADPVLHESYKKYGREYKQRTYDPARHRELYLRNREKRIAISKRSNFRRRGITAADYAELLAAQGGVCAICSNPPAPNKRLAIDHDHNTQTIRGLLCSNCNTGLGLLGDDQEILARAIAYLHPRLSLLMTGA